MFTYIALHILALPTIIKAAPPPTGGPDFEHLPRDTIFPGIWEQYIRAPANKSYILPVKIFAQEGPVYNPDSVLQQTVEERKRAWNISTGGLVTFQFEENISGR